MSWIEETDKILLDSEIETLVRVGFLSRQEIYENVESFAWGELNLSAVDEDALGAWVDEALRQHYVQQRSWPFVTDCDRLSEAFAELDRNGIVAREHFTCCQTCGHAEILSEIAATEDAGREVRGYVFYHSQDAGTVLLKGYLYLAYNSVSGKDKESLAVANEICDTLRAHKLEVTWSGQVRTRIKLEDLVWERRRLKELDYA